MKNKKVTNPKITDSATIQASPTKNDFRTTIQNHKKAAEHHAEAAKYHLQAAKYYEEGNKEKAAHSFMLAYGHHAIAGEFVNDDAKHHAQTLKQTNYQ